MFTTWNCQKVCDPFQKEHSQKCKPINLLSKNKSLTNSMGADPGPAAPALSPAPGALLYADLSESGLSPPNPPDDGGCDGRDLASVRACRLRVAGTISGGK